ncbi:MAG: hypothetical protein AAF633_07655 [Chloroflexota bacterium]
MKANEKPTVSLSLSEAAKLQEIESNPLTKDEITRHQQFEREGISVEDRIKIIKADIDSPAHAAE